MPRITFQGIVNRNFNLIVSPYELKSRYLSGIPLPDSITDENLSFFLESAAAELENYLSLKINKTIIIEDKDFYADDWRQWGFIKCTYPCVCAVELQGWLGTVQQISYPHDWLSSRKTNDNRWYSRIIYLVPNRSSSHSEALIYSGTYPQASYFGNSRIPDYWKLKYVTGWDNPPVEIIDTIGMLTSVKVLQIISDALMIGALRRTVNQQGQQVVTQNGTSFGGLGLGMSSKSISIDGLSQSYSSYVNGSTGVWGARLKQYMDMLNPSSPGSLLNRLYDQYAAITMGVG